MWFLEILLFRGEIEVFRHWLVSDRGAQPQPQRKVSDDDQKQVFGSLTVRCFIEGQDVTDRCGRLVACRM